jgi:hypothetical protein
MATTQVFVELLIIGMGAGIWLVLLLAAILGYRFDTVIPKADTWCVVVLGGLAYVLGITVDRLARNLFKAVENRMGRKRSHDAEASERRERYILTNSEALAGQIHYNRSRLRICRAWTLNIFLTLVFFLFWNLRVGAIEPGTCAAMIVVGCVLCALVATAAWTLSGDCEKNLVGSYTFLKEQKERMTEQPL